MSNYWQIRQAEQKMRFQLKTEKELEQKLGELYRAAANKITVEIMDIYPLLLEEDVLANNYYRYVRLFKLREQINQELSQLGIKELEELENSLKQMYIYSTNKTLQGLNFKVKNNKELNNLVKSLWDNRSSWSETVWCNDGLSGSQRVSKSMTQLYNTLERGMNDCVLRGASKDELVKTLQQRFNVSYSQANRLARTELTYIQNQATKDSYIKAGVEEYQYFAELDSRTSDLCEELNGKRFKVNSAVVGVNYPPLHPNCRSTVLAVINQEV